MDGLFLIKLFLSFITGSLWVISTTILSDRFGTKIGGTIMGLPSTVMFSLLFIGWTQSAQVAVESTTILPAVGGVVTLFMVCYIVMIKKGVWIALLLSLLVWTILSFGLTVIGIQTILSSLSIYFCLLLLSFYVVEYKMYVPAVKGKKINYTFFVVMLRGVSSGGIVALAVFLAKVSGPVFGGMFAIFPAATVGTILITYFAHGAAFSAAVVKTILFSMTSVIVYALLVRYTYIPLGIGWGTVISAIGAAFTVWLLFHWIIKKSP